MLFKQTDRDKIAFFNCDLMQYAKFFSHAVLNPNIYIIQAN